MKVPKVVENLFFPFFVMFDLSKSNMIEFFTIVNNLTNNYFRKWKLHNYCFIGLYIHVYYRHWSSSTGLHLTSKLFTGIPSRINGWKNTWLLVANYMCFKVQCNMFTPQSLPLKNEYLFDFRKPWFQSVALDLIFFFSENLFLIAF